MAIPAWQITHTNGTTTAYQASADTDVARGTAFLTAQAALLSGETLDDVSVAKTHDVVTSKVTGVAGAAGTPTLIRGAGSSGATTIYSQISPGTSAGSCVKPAGDNIEWWWLKIIANEQTAQTDPVGNQFGDTGNYSNSLFAECQVVGAVDAFLCSQSSLKSNVRLLRCRGDSNFDTCNFVGSGVAAGSTWEIINCDFLVQYPHPTYPYPSYAAGIGVTCRGLSTAAPNVIVTAYNCRITAGGGASNVNTAVVKSNASASISVYDSTLSSTGTNALDISSSAGSVVVGNTVYNAGKTSGVVNDVLNAYAPGPPTDLAVQSISGGAFLTWVRNSTNETGFKIDYATDAAFTANVGATTAPAKSVSASIGGLTSGVLYYFRVKSTNATGDSTASNIRRVSSGSSRTGGTGGGRINRVSRVNRV